MFSFLRSAKAAKETLIEITPTQVTQFTPTHGEIKSTKRQIHRAKAHMERFHLAMLQCADADRKIELEQQFRYYEGLYLAELQKVKD